MATIHMISMRASDLEKILNEKGAKWICRRKCQILPPENPTDIWTDFQNECFLK